MINFMESKPFYFPAKNKNAYWEKAIKQKGRKLDNELSNYESNL